MLITCVQWICPYRTTGAKDFGERIHWWGKMHESAVALQQPTAFYGFSPVPFGKELCRFFQKNRGGGFEDDSIWWYTSKFRQSSLSSWSKNHALFFSMTSWCYSNIYLVGDLEHVFSPYIGNFIIPTDELIFFRGVGIGIGVAARVPHELLRDPAVNPSGHIVGGAHGSFSWCSSHCHLIGWQPASSTFALDLVFAIPYQLDSSTLTCLLVWTLD